MDKDKVVNTPVNGLYGSLPSKVDFYPFVVSINEFTNKYQQCGGSIISDFHVLTSCQCFSSEENIKIRKKANDYIICALCKDLYQREVTFPVNDIMLHPACRTHDAIYDYNLAVIEAKDSFDILSTAAPINLPKKNMMDDLQKYIQLNMTFQIVSYGETGLADDPKNLMEAAVKLTSWEDCHQFFELSNFDSGDKDKLCLDVSATNVSACDNDDGYPVFVESYLWGIISTTNYVHNCTKNQLTIVARIDTSIDWIEWCINNASSISVTLALFAAILLCRNF